jgi:hypothetical protein
MALMSSVFLVRDFLDMNGIGRTVAVKYFPGDRTANLAQYHLSSPVFGQATSA